MRLEVMGISLCMAAKGAYAPENSAQNDKAKRQTVFETVWRFAHDSLFRYYVLLRLIMRFRMCRYVVKRTEFF